MCKKTPLPKRFLKNLSEKLKPLQVKYEISGCSSVNLYFQDESRFGLLTILRRMITAKGVKPVAPFLHRFSTLYIFGAFSPLTGDNYWYEMPACNSNTFQVFLDAIAADKPDEFKVLILDNGAFHHAKSLRIPTNIALLFLPAYSPELNPAEKMWRYVKDRVSMIAYENLQALQNKLSGVIGQINQNNVKSICGNQFYINTFKCIFNV
jgi:DDE superfamily endonuclease